MVRRFLIIFVSILFLLSVSACSTSSDDASEKGAIEKFTKKTADDALHAIQDPINQAKALENIGSDRQKMLDESLGEK